MTEADVRGARAIALSYGDRAHLAGEAPRVVASGYGAVAEVIIAKAREAGVPVHESRELVAALMHLDLDQRIPPALYLAVAEILAWAHRLEDEAGRRATRASARVAASGA